MFVLAVRQKGVGYLGTLPLRVFKRRIDFDRPVARGSLLYSTELLSQIEHVWSRPMAKLFLKFEDRILQEILLSGGTVTIGRQPDNILRIDNPAVSGHHAKVYAEGDHYVIEDAESFNGTYVNGQRISKVVLKDGDSAIIGKHTIEFRVAAQYGILDSMVQVPKTRPPQLDRTVFLDTAKAKEMLAKATAAASSAGPVAAQTIGIAQGQPPVNRPLAVHQTIGTLTIVKGRTDQQHYVLTSKLTLIGRSKMAGIRLKRWFAPDVAASIYRAEDGYVIAASGDKVEIKVNDTVVEGGQKQIEAGDVIEVAGIKAVFGFCEG
jgi:predicted component of type VI protein secretion system